MNIPSTTAHFTGTWATPWQPSLWQTFPLSQGPTYQNKTALNFITNQIHRNPALIPLSEIRVLKSKLAFLHANGGFFIQGGDCAETFETSSRMYTAQRLSVLSSIYEEVGSHFSGPLLVGGRLAGQFAKPRSNPIEFIKGVPYTSYYGDIVNGFSPHEREPEPNRMLAGYTCAREVLDDIRRLTINRNPKTTNLLTLGDNLFTAHEAYLLHYEQSLCRQDEDGRWYGTSAHCLWAGERTRQKNGAHIQFLRGLSNPIGIKIGPRATAEELQHIINILNPEKQLGRLLFITRFGIDDIRNVFPTLLKELKNQPILWVCDPMHGNTTMLSCGLKTRHFNRICDELRVFFEILDEHGELPVGVHFEMTPLNVTECLDPKRDITEESICDRYTTACDPRLNRKQSLELAGICGQLLNHFKR